MSKESFESPPDYQTTIDPSNVQPIMPPQPPLPPNMVYAAYQSPYTNGNMVYSQQIPTTLTVIQQPVPLLINQHMIFGRYPQIIICPNCQAQVTTIVEYESGAGTWLFCFLLCILGLNLGCQFIPFCIDSCKDAMHICPNCNRVVGRRQVL